MGLLSWLFGSKKVEPEASPKKAATKPKKKKHSIAEVNAARTQAKALLKDSVALKKTDIDQAVANLKQVYELDKKYKLQLETSKLLRLPKYLQNAGRSSEALDEMGRLTAYGSSLSKSSKADFNQFYADIYDTFAQIKKKQKVNEAEITVDKFLVWVFRLNAWHYYHEKDNKERRAVDMDATPVEDNSNIMNQYKHLLELYADQTEMLDIFKLDFKQMPLKNINVQKYYDSMPGE